MKGSAEMGVELIKDDDKQILTAFIFGEIDHHTASSIRTEIDMRIEKEKPKELELDFAKVSFMDSSGIGLVMGRYKLMSEKGGVVRVLNPPPPIKRVMTIAGLNRLVKITEKANRNPENSDPKGMTENENKQST